MVKAKDAPAWIITIVARNRMRKRLAIPALIIGIGGIGVTIIWLYRAPIVMHYVDRTLAERGITARYTIDHVGFGTQRLRHVSIGDPRRPDLVAREIDLVIAIGVTGPRVVALTARDVMVRGRTDGRSLDFGQLDRLLINNGTPFAMPDVALDLSNIRMALVSPWGPIGLGGSARGNPQRDVAGRIAIHAPTLSALGCRAETVNGNVGIAINDGVPQFRGPVGAKRIACGGNGPSINALQLGINGSGAADLSDWRVVGTTASEAVRWGEASARGLRGTVSLAGNASLAGRARWDLTTHGLATPYLTTEQLTMRGRGDRDSAGMVTVRGAVAAPAARWGTAVSSRVARLRATDDSTPAGPLLRQLATALGGLGSSAAVRSDYQGTYDRMSGLSVALGDAAVAAQSGARVTLSGPRAIAWSSSGGLAMSGRLSFGGGGLPRGVISLDKPSGLAAVRGEAQIAPYAANGAVFALSPVRFTAQPDGSARFAGGIALSGPLAAGRIDGLALPLSGAVARDGTVRIAGGCTPIRWRSVRVGALTVGGNAVDLCSAAGQPLVTIAGNGVSGVISLPRTSLSGRVGTAPARIGVSGGMVQLSSDRFIPRAAFSLRNLVAQIGSGEAVTRFAATSVDGRVTDVLVAAGGLTGRFDNADLSIGAVPIIISGGAGDWRYANGALRVGARLGVRDRAGDARFQPLVSDDVTMSLIDDHITVTGRLREQVAAIRIVDVVIDHKLSTGDGHARFTVSGITFVRGGLQPVALSRLALGVIADTEGTVAGRGDIRWTGTGVTSSGVFETEALNLAAAFGPVQRLAGTIRFDDLLALSTPPGQEVTLGSVNPGVEVLDGQLSYQLLPGQQVRIEGGRWEFAGGTLRLQPALLDFSAELPRRLAFDVERIDAGLFLQRYEFDNITASGVFDGVMPTVFDQAGGRIEGGSLVSRSGGSLAYVGELTNRDLGVFGNIAFGALRSLRYDSLVVRMNGRIDGEMLTEVGFSGLAQGDGVQNNIATRALRRLPFTFNIRISAPFRQLLTSARGLYDPALLIEQNLPALIRAQAAGMAAPQAVGSPPQSNEAVPPELPPVQPSESERR